MVNVCHDKFNSRVTFDTGPGRSNVKCSSITEITWPTTCTVRFVKHLFISIDLNTVRYEAKMPSKWGRRNAHGRNAVGPLIFFFLSQKAIKH